MFTQKTTNNNKGPLHDVYDQARPLCHIDYVQKVENDKKYFLDSKKNVSNLNESSKNFGPLADNFGQLYGPRARIKKSFYFFKETRDRGSR